MKGSKPEARISSSLDLRTAYKSWVDSTSDAILYYSVFTIFKWILEPMCDELLRWT